MKFFINVTYNNFIITTFAIYDKEMSKQERPSIASDKSTQSNLKMCKLAWKTEKSVYFWRFSVFFGFWKTDVGFGVGFLKNLGFRSVFGRFSVNRLNTNMHVYYICWYLIEVCECFSQTDISGIDPAWPLNFIVISYQLIFTSFTHALFSWIYF